MEAVSVGPLAVVASTILIVVAVGLSWQERLGLGRSIVWAAVRAAAQLSIIGAGLGLVMAEGTPIVWAWLWVVAMLVIGGVTVASRVPEVPGVFEVTVTALGAAVALSLLVVFAFGIFPLEARTLIPAAGMLMGNAIGSSVLAARRTVAEIAEHRDAVEVRLALGQPARTAIRPQLTESMRTALTPQIETTKIVGIVALPGTMTGMLLAGMDPFDAVMTQTIVMFLILGSVAVVTVMVGRGVARRLITTDHRLVETPRNGG